MAPRVVALVLAAGASSRMGRPKALLDFDGPSCLGLVLTACVDGGVDQIVLVTGPAGDAVRQEAATWETSRVPGPPLARHHHPQQHPLIDARNPRPEQGMLSSIQAGLAHLPPGADAFLIFPVDFPLVPAAEVRRLLAAWSARPAGARIFVPSYDMRRGHPILVAAGLAAELAALPPEASARVVINAHAGALVHLPAADDRVLLDMDTPADYQRCLARHRQEIVRGAPAAPSGSR